MNVSVNKQLMSYQNCFVVLSRTFHKNCLKAVFSFQFHRRCSPAKLLSGPAMVCVDLLTSLTSSVVTHIEQGPSSKCVCACDPLVFLENIPWRRNVTNGAEGHLSADASLFITNPVWSATEEGYSSELRHDGRILRNKLRRNRAITFCCLISDQFLKQGCVNYVKGSQYFFFPQPCH